MYPFKGIFQSLLTYSSQTVEQILGEIANKFFLFSLHLNLLTLFIIKNKKNYSKIFQCHEDLLYTFQLVNVFYFWFYLRINFN